MQNLESKVWGRLTQLRLKELKEVLARLGLPRVGAKAVLLDRISKALEAPSSDGESWDSFPIAAMGRSRRVSKEAVEAAVEEVWAAWHRGGASRATPEKREARPKREGIVRCVCHTLLAQGAMVQCCACKAWQHNKCMLVPEDAAPADYLCEACRLAKGDPFSVAIGHPLPAAKLRTPLVAPVRGDNLMQQVERTFQLTSAHREMLLNPDHDLQVYSVLLNDPVPLRCHWPAYSDLRINGMVVRVTGRQGQQKLGVGGRDETPSIASVARDGLNRLSMSAYDDRPFCVGVRIIEKRSLEEIMARVPGPEEGESFDDALARVKRVVAGSSGQADDSDDELMTLQSAVSVRDPMSGTRIVVPGRFRSCTHLACFDLPTLVEINKRARKWQCPHCLQNCSLDDLIIDPYFHRVLSIFSREFDSDNTDLEIQPDGSWRAFLSGDAKKAAGGGQPRWHKPEETVETAATHTDEREVPTLKKEDDARRGSGILKIRLKRDRGDALGAWQIDRDRDGNSSGERPAKVRKTEGEGGENKSDVQKALPIIENNGKGKNVVIDLSDSSDDDEDLVIAHKPAVKKAANGVSVMQRSEEGGASGDSAIGLHSLLAAAAAADTPSVSNTAASAEMQRRDGTHTAESRPRAAVSSDGMWGHSDEERFWGGQRMQGRTEQRQQRAGGLEGGFVSAPAFDTGGHAAFGMPRSPPAFGHPPGQASEAARRVPPFVHTNSEVSRGPGFERYADGGRSGQGLVPSWSPRKSTGEGHAKGQRTQRTSHPGSRWGEFASSSGRDLYGAPVEPRNGFHGAEMYGAASLGGVGATSSVQAAPVDARNGYAGPSDRYDAEAGPLQSDSIPPGFGQKERGGPGATRSRQVEFNPFAVGGVEEDSSWQGYLERGRSPEQQGGQAGQLPDTGEWFPASNHLESGGLEPGEIDDRNGGRDGDNMDAWFRDTFGSGDGGSFGGLDETARRGAGSSGVWH